MFSSFGLILGIAVVPAAMQLIMLPICPESPRYLLITLRQEEKARKGKLLSLEEKIQLLNFLYNIMEFIIISFMCEPIKF